MRSKRKSQMEIMGLVVIVILLTLGMFFVIKFMVGKQPSEIKKTYTRTEVAANILNSMIKTSSTDCHGLTVMQLLQDVAENKETESYIICEDGKYSNETVKLIIQTIFNETLMKWGNQSFDFKTYMEYSPGEIIFQYTNQGCSGEREAKQQPIPTEVGTLIIYLEVC